MKYDGYGRVNTRTIRILPHDPRRTRSRTRAGRGSRRIAARLAHGQLRRSGTVGDGWAPAVVAPAPIH